MDFDVIVLGIVAILSVGSLVRVVRGPTIWDRLLGFSIFSAKVIVFFILVGFIINRSFMADVALIYALLSFTGVTMIARLIERKGDT